MQGAIFIGLQASGKSTYYQKKFSKTHIRLNMDMLRTRHREKLLFEACLEAKQPVVIDNTNPTESERASYIIRLKESDFEITGYYFASSLNECLNRNALRTGKERIPDVGLKGTYNKLELPQYSEGFDRLYYVAIKDNDFVMEEWKDEVW